MCDEQGNNLNRKRRQVDNGPKAEYRIDDPLFAQNATIELFGGFYVTDTTDNRDTRLFDGEPLDEVISYLPINFIFSIVNLKFDYLNLSRTMMINYASLRETLPLASLLQD